MISVQRAWKREGHRSKHSPGQTLVPISNVTSNQAQHKAPSDPSHSFLWLASALVILFNCHGPYECFPSGLITYKQYKPNSAYSLQCLNAICSGQAEDVTTERSLHYHHLQCCYLKWAEKRHYYLVNESH